MLDSLDWNGGMHLTVCLFLQFTWKTPDKKREECSFKGKDLQASEPPTSKLHNPNSDKAEICPALQQLEEKPWKFPVPL